MRKMLMFLIAALSVIATVSCNSQQSKVKRPALNSDLQGIIDQKSSVDFDSAQIGLFYEKFAGLSEYAADVRKIYAERSYYQIWFDGQGLVEFAHSLQSKVKGVSSEGIYAKFPYTNELDGIFESGVDSTLSQTETDLMITNMFLFYAEKVYRGVDDKTVAALEWLLPKKQVSYEELLDSMLINSNLLARNDSVLFSQYYKLRDKLQYYRDIQKAGGWDSITFDPKLKAYKPGDSAQTILQIRERLFITGHIAENNSSKTFDNELLTGVNTFQKRHALSQTKTITPKLIQMMNVDVDEIINKIAVNMERWRWISPEFATANEFIFVNIPSYTLHFNRDGKRVLESAVVVGKEMTKTVIFSGNMSSVVFSPYWNIPPSILNKEVLPGIKKDKNYLAKHNMEWNNGQVRQKPGKGNSLGQVKFLFPNSNNIYLHDTPSKSFFNRDSRAFSHGCVRVAKPRDLAIEVLKDDPSWTPEKIDAAMKAGKEDWVQLKKKIPVYIGYFTAWVSETGDIYFYEDVYSRDQRLHEILVGE